MPGFDGSGPRFEGPLTGGARGYCTGGIPFARRDFGDGRGRGRRQGAGVGAWRGPSTTSVPDAPDGRWELARLERQAIALQRSLDAVHERLQLLKKTDRTAEKTPGTPDAA